jgi:uncharacterized protein YeeX (DUF496 family)
MHHEHRSTEHSDFHTVVNTFTQGLRELPTDYVTRVKNFLAEYLGSPQYPVPFGGRIKDFENLDSWLNDSQASPYLLLAAPAGRGKSALLVRWCQRLLTQQGFAIVYFPVSIRFRTNLAGVSFPSLVALLAKLHGEKVPADPNLHEEVWRSLFIDYITRPLPDGQSLVLVLDGVDEAADWVASPDLFPLNPPPGLRVVLSARYLANDQDANAWLKRLGWTRQGLARTLELYPLDRTGIASVLVQMGFPLDILGTRVNIVSELYRLSEGDPLLVRLYVDDLWKRGDAAVHLQPEDLRAIRPGLVGYFERWWKDQRLLWSNDAPQREAAAQIVLNLLAGALGPLSKEDILSLASDETSFTAADLAQHLAPLARFVTGDGIRQGYVFSHPRLGNYFLEERLSEIERQQIEQRFLAWGKQTLTALNDGSLAPENASPYIIQYYGTHLERAQADASTLLTLVSDGWRRAWEKLDRANAGFLSDIERAWRATEREDTAAINAGNPAPYLGEEIRCLLSQVSINSMTSNISPKLMLEAVKTGIWTPAQGLACIRLITDLAPRARELVGLAPYVQEPLRTNILQEALDTAMTIKDEYARLDALIELSSSFPEELLRPILEIIPTIEDEADKAEVLAELAPALTLYNELLEKSLDYVQEMEEEEYRALALEGLAPCLSEDLHARTLQLVSTIQEERYRAQALTALIPHLTESFLQEILQAAHTMQDGLSQMRLITKLVQYLPDGLRAAAMQKVLELERNIEDREYRVEILVGLAPFLSEQILQQALQETQLLWDESHRARTLSDLIPYMPAELLPKFLHTVQEMRSEECRTQVLLRLLPGLSEELLTQVLDTVQATWDEGCRVELLAQIAPYASETLLPRLLEIVSTIKDKGYRVWILAELEASLPKKLDENRFNIFNSFQAMKEKEERLQIVLAILPRLSEGALSKILSIMLPQIFDFSWRVRSDESRAHILAKLGSRLPEEWLPTAISMIWALGDEVYQVQVLVALAPHIGETHLSAVLDIIRGLKDREKRTQVLVALVSSLPEEGKGQKIQEMLQVLQIIKDEAERTHVFVASAPYLPATLPVANVELVIKAVQAMRDDQNRAKMLKALASHLPESTFDQILRIAQMLKNDNERAEVLEALAPFIPESFFPYFLDMVYTLQNKRWQTQALTTALSYASEKILVDMLAAVQNIQDEYQRAEVLSALAPQATQTSFAQLWQAMQAISDEGTRVQVLEKLAQHMPEEFFPQLWKAIQRISSEGWQMWIVRALAPRMSESLFSQIWKAVQAIKNREKHTALLVTLAPHIPERFFSSFWEEARTIHDKKIQWRVLEALASHVPEEFIPQFLIAVRTFPNEPVRMQMMLPLFSYIPERLFPLLWGEMQTIQNKRLQAKMLLELVPHVSEHSLPYIWEAMQTIDDIVAQMHILQALSPHLSQEKLIEALHRAQTLSYGQWWGEIVEAVIPYLSEEKRLAVLDELISPEPEEQLVEIFTYTLEKKQVLLRTLTAIISYLPHEKQLLIIRPLLKALQVLKAEEDKMWFLDKLAFNVPEELVPEMFEVLWSLKAVLYQVPILEKFLQKLLPSLSQTAWVKVLELAQTRMRATEEIYFTVRLLKAADNLVPQSTSALLYPIVHDVIHLISQYTRKEAFINLAFLIPTMRTISGTQAIVASCSATLEVGNWWP